MHYFKQRSYRFAFFISLLTLTSFGLGACAKSSKNLAKPVYVNPKSGKIKTDAFNKKQAKVGEKYNVVIDLPVFETSANEITKSTESAIAQANISLDAIANTKTTEVNFDNTVKALEDLYYELGLVGYRVGLLAETSNDMKLKAEAKKMEVKISKWSVDAESREDVYKTVQAYADTKPTLEGEDALLLENTLREYKRIGFHLPKETQDKIKVLKKELAELTDQISKNIATANKEIFELTEEEVKGIPKSQLDQLTKTKDGKYSGNIGVSFQSYGVITSSPIEAVREKIWKAYMSRAQGTNPKLMNTVVEKRAELANLLGYKTWADYKTEIRMAKSGDTALQFIKGLAEGLRPKFEKEVATLSDIKSKKTGHENSKIMAWDIFHFVQEYEKDNFKLDLEALRKYFKYENVLSGMFKIYEGLFKLKIEKIEAPYVWDEMVELYQITDSRNNKPLGYLYLDMFPRQETEKYGHFASFTLRSGKIMNDGKSRRPINALVCNFPKPEPGKPSLLTFGQVETLFHEFGHALHSILSETKYATFAGTNVAQDFVEAPSQMLESWVTDKKVLDSFAVNYEDPNDKIPADTLVKIKAANLATVGISYTRQFSYGLMDLEIHTATPGSKVDVVKTTNEALDKVYINYPEGTSFITSFGHLFGGYDAGYYGYAWADNLAADMASIFEASPDGFLDAEIGMRLRTEIYERGSSRDINTSIESFLLRQPTRDAFLKKLGIE